jgi:D-alanyl-D-alanine carboxypeptidase
VTARRCLTAVVAATVAALLTLTVAPAASAEDKSPAAQRQELERIIGRLAINLAVGVTAEVKAGGRTWRFAFGRSQVDPMRAARTDSRFRAASVTKQLTSVLALRRVEQGDWTLDTTIGDVLPTLWPERADVTLRQLLSHTSGMPDYLSALVRHTRTSRDFVRAVSKPRTDAQLVRRAQSLPWLFEPGTDFAYSNTGFVVIGMMLEAETDSSVRALARREILRPARMTESTFPSGRGMRSPRLREYAWFGPQLVDLHTAHPSMFSSAGALVTTARDLNRFQAALSRGDLVGRPLVRTMHSVVADGPKYGLGSFRLPDPCRRGSFLNGHDGASWGTLTMSFASAPGAGRRVTIAMTGRPYTPREMDKALDLLARFVFTGASVSCGDRRLPADRTALGLDYRSTSEAR